MKVKLLKDWKYKLWDFKKGQTVDLHYKTAEQLVNNKLAAKPDVELVASVDVEMEIEDKKK